MASHHPIRKQVSPQPTIIPDKLYFRIGDVAQLCDVPAYVLRFWETEFPQLKPNKGGTGQRLYRKRDVEMALRIKSLLYDEGYTIQGARQVFKAEAKAKEASDSTPAETIAAAEQPVIGRVSAERTPSELAPTDRTPLEPALDIGAAIRQDARNRDHLSGLRDELRSLADLLAAPITSAIAPETADIDGSPIPAKLKPMRPRLVSVATLAPRAELKPILIDQGDLFSSE